jgi:DNA-directed RNA polymerase subunit RPC12/RpoP
MDKDVFVANLKTVKERKILLLRVALSILFVTLVASVWVGKAHPHDAVQTTFKTFSMLGYAIVVYACVAAVQRMTRRLGLHCPHCGRSLSGPLSHRVVDSGNCSHCGSAIF